MKKRSGFTLIEVTVALAIFGLASVVLTQSFLGGMYSLEAFKYDDVEEETLWFVQNQVINLEKRDDIESGGQVETIKKGLAKWEGRLEGTGVLDVHKLVLKVKFVDERFEEKGGEVEEEFYLYRPKWSLSADRDRLLREKKEKFKG